MRKKKICFTDIIIVFIIASVTAFVIKVLDVFEKTGLEPAALIAGVFGAAFGEFGLLTLIYRFKNDKTKRKQELQDRRHNENREDRLRHEQEEKDERSIT